VIDLKLLRENPDVIRNSQKSRGEDVSLVDQLIAADEARRIATSEFETLRAEQNVLSKSVGSAKGDEKTALLESAKELASKVKAADAKLQQRKSCYKFQTSLTRQRQSEAKLISRS